MLHNPALKKKGVSKRWTEFPIRDRFFEVQDGKTYLTNYFEISLTKKVLWEYEILDLDRQGQKKKICLLFEKAINAWPFLLKNRGSFATDSMKTIVSWIPLHNALPDDMSLQTRGDPNKPLDETSAIWNARNILDGKDGQSPIQARFSLVGKVNVDALLAVCNSDAASIKTEVTKVERCLNILIASSLTNETVRTSGKKFFVRAARDALHEKGRSSMSLEMIRGYYFAVKPGMGNMLLNFNIATSAFFRPILVSEFLADRETFGNLETRFNLLKKLRVFIELPWKNLNISSSGKGSSDYLNETQARIKTVSGQSSDNIEDLFFHKKQQESNGTFKKDANGGFVFESERTYIHEYLEKVFGKKVQHGRRAINVGSRTNEVWYAQEHLRILPYQIYTRPIPDHLAISMVNTAAYHPAVSQHLIENEGLSMLCVPAVGNVKKPFRNNIPLEIYPTMLRVNCQKLPFPDVQYRNMGKKHKIEGSGWNLHEGEKFWSTPAGKCDYMLIQGVDKTEADIYETAFQSEVAARLEIPRTHVKRAHAADIRIDNNDLYDNDKLSTVLNKTLAKAREVKADIVLFIIPSFDKEIYRTYKNLADCVYGLRSICLTMKSGNLTSADRMTKYMTNVAMKVNSKLGGTSNWNKGVENLGKDTMVLGADVVHPGANAFEGCPSIASIVGSVDDSATKYLGSMRLQSKPKTDREIIDHVKEMVLDRLADWNAERSNPAKTNKSAIHVPRNIIYFRDGVSEGQYSKVLEQEVEQITAAWRLYKKNNAPKHGVAIGVPPTVKITAIVVGKRHHTRFYPIDRHKDARGNENCLPGTLVDRAITSPYYRDFYLQSHSGIKGTARSTHYFVIRDDVIPGLTPSFLPQKIHALCYSYCRATTGVSYATPTYYADRLCERGRLYMSKCLSGNDDAFKNDLEAAKNTEIQRLKSARNAQFRASNTEDYDPKTHGPKSSLELQQEEQDRNDLDSFVRPIVMNHAEEEFYQHKKNAQGNLIRSGNPWSNEFGKHMFWM
ncbi:Piwi-domain-containing protein [Bimuria novae-zelandiae CBS 107.79]|uniref:Piwi-domain-containing protein n=1 Tax=Bimuria novae-zelandiae CBS 107.79 TaxID=1447943 RepID=A0A6A5UN18_9PLEO|nr:Piwi-domain-containing protein [Bimuria novae-zelandiae CBS 107.79]